MTGEDRAEDLLRELAPQVLAVLVRRHGQFEACEDAVQEALLAAARQWPQEGVPEWPRSWLLTVAGRALIDAWRADSARRRRETMAALDLAARPVGIPGGGADGDFGVGGQDDTLVLLFLCCHPALSPPSQLALTLRAVGGLTTAQIAAAFLVPEATIAKRIARAKQRISDSGARFQLPAEPARSEQLGVVMQVLYLIFNEGYTTSSGPALRRADLTAEAIRLARLLHRLLPGEAEVAGLIALMLLTDARRAARTYPDGRIVPLAEQQRELWDAAAITEGQAILTRTLGTGPVGPYQLQAAIAALHDEAPAAAANAAPTAASANRPGSAAGRIASPPSSTASAANPVPSSRPRARNRRTQPRAVVYGTPARAAAGRTPHTPPATCPSTAPTVSATSSRQASTNAGNRAWLTRHGVHRSRGTKILQHRPASRT